MAKQAVTKIDDLESQLTTSSSAELQAGTGQGISQDAADNLIPIITVFQFLSPETMSGDPRYIDGAKAGTIWLRNSPEQSLIDGDKGFIWQRAGFQRQWIEWRDREQGGGFVARYDDVNGVPDLKGARRNPSNNFNFINPESDNEISLFHNHIGYVLGMGAPQPYLISYKGAGITVSRNWMSSTPRLRADTGAPADAWDFLWHVQAKLKTNAKGKWYDLVPVRRLDGYAKPQQVQLARDLALGFETNKLQADTSNMRTGAPTQSMAEEMKEEIPF